jgi:hypothetical protein
MFKCTPVLTPGSMPKQWRVPRRVSCRLVCTRVIGASLAPFVRSLLIMHVQALVSKAGLHEVEFWLLAELGSEHPQAAAAAGRLSVATRHDCQ